MKKFILILLSLMSLNSFAQTYPWPEGVKCGRHIGMNIDGKLIEAFTQYNWYSTAWREIIADMAILMNKPDLKLSFEYMQYRAGYRIMKDTVDHAADCNQMPDADTEIVELKKKSDAGTLTKDDFKGPRWIHTLQAIDVEEANCMAMSKKAGKLAGCGDVWQDGITSDEAVCIKDKTYIKCHVDCLAKIYDRTIESKPGFCE